MIRATVLAVLLGFAAAASAQIIYKPVEYQYDAGGTKYYYGGSNPRTHAAAAECFSASGTWGRTHGLAFGSGDIDTHREVASEPLRVFSDRWRSGVENAHLVGFTISDARNEAMANVPRYFVKRDLLRAAVRVEGAWIIAASAVPVHVYVSSPTRSATEVRPLMIIPKPLDRPNPTPGKTLVSITGEE